MIMKINVSDDNFEEEVIAKSNQVPVLVDFWAPWCGPCLMLSPVIEEALDSAEFRERVLLAKANTSDCQLNAVAYDVNAIPNLKLFKNGKVIAETKGFMPLPMIQKWLRDNLK